jgi:hypothetical protein
MRLCPEVNFRRLCRRRRPAAPAEAATSAGAPQAATRAMVALFAHGCVQAQAFSF